MEYTVTNIDIDVHRIHKLAWHLTGPTVWKCHKKFRISQQRTQAGDPAKIKITRTE